MISKVWAIFLPPPKNSKFIEFKLPPKTISFFS